MPRFRSLAVVALLALPSLGCLGTPVASGAGGPQIERRLDPDAMSPASRSTVVTREQFDDDSGPLLGVLLRAVPSIRTEHSTGCPRLSLRGPVMKDGYASPELYVDGTHVGDTCVLSTLSAADVERVEIYPTGATPRAGYSTAPYGLILVFLRR